MGRVIVITSGKGGVGKTTICAYLGMELAKSNNRVCLLDMDIGLNNLDVVLGIEDRVIFSLADVLNGKCRLTQAMVEHNVYPLLFVLPSGVALRNPCVKTEMIKIVMEDLKRQFDYILIDFPPSSSRLTEILLEISDSVCIVVGLDTLGLGGFWNTIQYFIDNELDIDSIKYIIPNGFSKNRRAPKVSLEKLREQVVEFTPNATLLDPLSDKSIIKNLQAEGISAFDVVDLPPYDRAHKEQLEKDLNERFSKLEF